MAFPRSIPRRFLWLGLATLAVVAAISAVVFRSNPSTDKKSDTAKAAAKPALTVTVTQPARAEWPRMLNANGNIAAWQEVIIGPELNGFRIVDVLVNVGDVVKRGQLLARIASDTVAADLSQARASVAEAEATLAEARANAARNRDLQEKGFVSAQAGIQSATAEQAAEARRQQAQARLQSELVRLNQTRVVAPDDGVISARKAALGSLANGGDELFRLIRDNRLEWRAEVTGAELGQIKSGMPASLTIPGGERVVGKVRAAAPTVDAASRTAIVYVDLPVGSPARAGMFARGDFELGAGSALTLPQSAVLLRDGFHYVFSLGPDNTVALVKVTVGQRNGDRIEIIDGIEPSARVVATGAAFLADGDTVRIVDSKANANNASKPAGQATAPGVDPKVQR